MEVPSGANNEATLLELKALLNSAKLASNNGAKAQSVQIALPHEAKPYGKAILVSSPARRTAFKAKSRVKLKTFQPIRANF